MKTVPLYSFSSPGSLMRYYSIGETAGKNSTSLFLLTAGHAPPPPPLPPTP